MDRPLVAFATQTAALEGAPHLVELGAVRVEGGEIQDTFDCLVCPPVPIEPGATERHGITEEDVRAAPMAAEVIESYTHWVGEDWQAAHGADWHGTALGFEYARGGLTPPATPVIDSLALAQRLIPEAQNHELGALCGHLDLEQSVHDSTHSRALADAVWCWKVIEECMERSGGMDGARLGELLAKCGAPVTLPAQMPTPPTMTTRSRSLEKAITEEAVVVLLYGGSADSLASLKVQPRFRFERGGKGYLEAECQSTGLLKTYRLDRIRRVESPDRAKRGLRRTRKL